MESFEFIKLLEELKKLQDSVQHLKDTKQDSVRPYRSTETHELAAALSSAHGEMKSAVLDDENPWFKDSYASLESVIACSRPALSKFGLCVSQIILEDDGVSVLHTIMLHVSGQFIESRMRIVPPKNDIHTLVSYTTSIKRIAYCSLVGVVSKGDDDDGEIAMADTRAGAAKGVALNTKYDPKENTTETVSRDQLDEIEYELGEYTDIAEQVLSALKIRSLADIPKSKYGISIRRIREIKNLRENPKKQ